MLVLSRKSGERIHVGDDIVVEVKRVTGTRVTIAIEAPRDLRILRGELKEAATAFEIETATSETPPSRMPSNEVVQEQAEPAASIPKPLPTAASDSFVLAHQQLDRIDPNNQAFA